MKNNSFITSVNPATGSIIDSIECSSNKVIDEAMNRALEAFDSWSLISLDERITYIRQFQGLVKTNSDKISELISRENGKPLWESRLEVQGVIAKVDLSVKSFQERCSGHSFNKDKTTFSYAYKPLGVVSVLGPFNFPAHLPQGHIIPALLSGNVVCFKPSDHTSLVGELMVNLWHESGLPKDVLQLIVGGADQGAYLTTHPDIQGILFTGGSRVGLELSSFCAKDTSRLLALEMGGNNPLVITDYSDIPRLVDLVVKSAFLTSGQRCTCARRLICVEHPDYDIFLKALIDKVSSLTIGGYDQQPEPYMGPLISSHSCDLVIDRYNHLIGLGGESLIEPRRLDRRGFFVSPGIVDMTDSSRAVDEECFGPLLSMYRVPDFKHAIEVANHTKYGLSASLISSSRSEFDQFFHRVKAGIINWNQPTNGASGALPFGGVGKSGNYRPSGYFAIDSCVYPVSSVMSDHL